MTGGNYEGPITPVVVARPVPTSATQRLRAHLSIIALTLGILLMLGALYTSVQTMRLLNTVNDRLTETTVPDAPADPTGCPFGEGECGG